MTLEYLNHHLSQRSPACRVAIIGECMIELFGTPPNLTQGFAGDTLNTAVYLSRLCNHGEVEVQYMTAVGTDPYSTAMLALWRREEIQCDFVKRDPQRIPGLYSISVDAQGERSFHYWRNEAAAKWVFEGEGSDTRLAALATFNWIYLSGISVAILPEESRERLLDSLNQARQQGVKVAFDNNFRPRLWPSVAEACAVYDRFMAECDLAFLTLDDEVAMRPGVTIEQVQQRCASLNIPEVVIKRGSDDCLVSHHSQQWQVPACKVSSVVDTTAAGDSFSAAYLAARIQELSPEHAAGWGHQLASTVIQYPGALIPLTAMPSFN